MCLLHESLTCPAPRAACAAELFCGGRARGGGYLGTGGGRAVKGASRIDIRVACCL